MKKSLFIVFACFVLMSCASEKPVFKDGNNMPVQTERHVIGLDMKAVRKAFGEPFVIRKEPPNELWTYRKDGCITMLYFDDDGDVCHAERRGDCPRMPLTVKE